MSSPEKVEDLYLDLITQCLTRYDLEPTGDSAEEHSPSYRRALREGRACVADAETMIGLKRLRNIRDCVTTLIAEDVPGDLIEAGVWRGGACIFMRAILAAYGEPDRNVWLADSFQGLPPPSEEYPLDADDLLYTHEILSVSRHEVEENFRRYGLLDDRVRFIEGWFAETLCDAPIDRLALVRLDGDMYGSTMEALTALYPRLSVGGYLIVDDYGCIPACRAAVTDYRADQEIVDEIHEIDWTGVYWRKGSTGGPS